MTDSEAATAALAAQALNAARLSHKRAAQHHRRQAKACAERLDDLRRSCAALGITLIIDTAEEAQS